MTLNYSFSGREWMRRTNGEWSESGYTLTFLPVPVRPSGKKCPRKIQNPSVVLVHMRGKSGVVKTAQKDRQLETQYRKTFNKHEKLPKNMYILAANRSHNTVINLLIKAFYRLTGGAQNDR